jgi:allantoin racemase
MPKALVINPNTSAAMTADIQATAERVFRPPWQVVVSMAPAGPESLESWADYHLASVCSMPLLAQHPDADGLVLACFGDPGLYALKELFPGPAVGIAEAAMSVALPLGAQFGILAGMGRAVELMDSMVRTYGLEARYAGSVALEMRVLEFESQRRKTLQTLIRASRELRRRGAEVLLLGCAGLTSYVQALQEEVEMPVVDPVEAGCRLLQLLVESGLDTSHVGLFARPAPQEMNAMQRIFSPQAIERLRKTRQG